MGPRAEGWKGWHLKKIMKANWHDFTCHNGRVERYIIIMGAAYFIDGCEAYNLLADSAPAFRVIPW